MQHSRLMVAHARGHHAHGAIPHLYPEEFRPRRHLRQPAQPFQHVGSALTGIDRQHHVLSGVALEALEGWDGSLSQVHHAPRVAQAGGGADQDGGIELLAELEGQGHEGLGLLAVGGFQQRDGGESGIKAVILLVLGAVHPRVVRAQHH